MSKTYLVGGACRDQLLGIASHDKDYVVVGSTPDEMLAQGFEQVGSGFPVFLHPQTKDEYALARTERKCGVGYKGFVCDFNPETTLAMDQNRRDLSINSIAQDLETGQLIDPCGGIQDIKDRILRHCSEAFRDDPLRVLRIARFAAKFYSFGFHIANETMDLMREMVKSGELDHLTPERIWDETVKALRTQNPEQYFYTLLNCGALRIIMPELSNLYNVPQPVEHHPEVDTFIHVMMCLEQAVKMELSTRAMFAVLVHDLGKGITPQEEWPHHKGHEGFGVPLVEAFCDRLRVPNQYRWMGVKACEYHLNVHKIMELNHKTLVTKLIELGAIQNHQRFVELLKVCEADSRGRLGLENRAYPQSDYALKASYVLLGLTYKDLADKYTGDKLVEAIRKRRYAAMAQFKQIYTGI